MFTIEEMIAIFPDYHGKAEKNKIIEEVVTDSRQKTERSLFVPLSGEKFDGHRFLKQAIDQGAVATLWDKTKPLPSFLTNDIIVLLVDDTLHALQKLAIEYRNKVNPMVIGITGSNGKTTTKDIVTTILSTEYKTTATKGNLNNHIGVPLTILSMKANTEMLVLEMGMNNFNEIDALSRMARPDIAIITNIGESHIEFLGTREGIAQAKLEIINGLKSDGLLIIDGDEKLLEHVDNHFNIIKCGFKLTNDIIIQDVSVEPEQTVFQLSNNMDYTIPLLGKHHAKNATYGIALGKHLGINNNHIKEALNSIQLTSMRFELSQGINDVSIINDAYNASPTSMKAAIEVVKEIPDFKEKVLILGDIFELGDQSVEMHQSIAEVIERPITVLFTIGHDIQATSREVEMNHNNIKVCHFHTRDELLEGLQPYLNPTSILLFKASRGMKFESLIDCISGSQSKM